MGLVPPAPVRRVVFGVYALALVLATHWPALSIQSPTFSRLDLVVHALAFGAWAALLIGAGFFGPVFSARNFARAGAVALVYAAADELSQGIPVLRRTVDPLDLLANGVGIVFGVTVMAVAGAARAGHRAR